MGKVTKKSADRRLIKIWGKLVKQNAGHSCEVCGQSFGKLDAHHIIGKRNRVLRYDLRNGVCLCATHHTLGVRSAHGDPFWFATWMKTHRLDDYNYLNSTKNQIKKWELEEMKDLLERYKVLLDGDAAGSR